MNDALAELIRLESGRERAPVPKIALFNVKYSPNLGDGLLAECLESEIRSQLGQAHVQSIDLAGRLRYETGRADRALLLSILQASPLFIRQAASKAVLGSLLSRKLRPLWRENLRGVDAVIVGGGNLLSDTDLNFPLKLRAALTAARELATPVGVYALGASDNWSAQGAAMFAEAFGPTPLFFASVRDARSAEIWRRRLGPIGVAAPEVVYDPGLLAYAHFAAPARPQRASPCVGLGIMHPTTIKYHSGRSNVTAARQAEWTLGFVNACLAQGWTTRLFTNGGSEDQNYLNSLKPALTALNSAGRVGVEPRFATPGELARFIANLDLLYAHRLHANIAAYSYAVPHIGFSWDAKLKSFLARIGRTECLVTLGADTIEQAVQLGRRQLQIGVDRNQRHAVIRQAHKDVSRLVDKMQTQL